MAIDSSTLWTKPFWTAMPINNDVRLFVAERMFVKCIDRIPVEVVLAHQLPVAKDHDALEIMMRILGHRGINRLQRSGVNSVVGTLSRRPAHTDFGLRLVCHRSLPLGRRRLGDDDYNH